MFAMSKHALDRAVDMAVEGHEIRAAMLRPRHVHQLPGYTAYYTHGRITLVVATDNWVVKTILWATANAWIEDRQYGEYDGRSGDADMAGVRRAVKARKKQQKGWR